MGRVFSAGLAVLAMLAVSCETKPYTPGETSAIGKNQRVELLNFTAKWCPACRKVPPVLKELRPEFPHVKFRELDLDASENTALVEQYRVTSIPHFELLVDGRSVGTFRGARSAEYISGFIRSHVQD